MDTIPQPARLSDTTVLPDSHSATNGDSVPASSGIANNGINPQQPGSADAANTRPRDGSAAMHDPNTIQIADARTSGIPNNAAVEVLPWQRPRGPVPRIGGRTCIGRVGAPRGHEATSEKFCFWVPPEALVEKTQLVTCHSSIAGRDITFYALIDEVHRTSRGRSMAGEMDGYDGDLNYEPPFDSEGCTYASASILRSQPPLLTPPRERSEVLLAGAEEARIAYRADEISNGLTIGLIKNGGDGLAGPGTIDLDYLLGANGGHLNVNGAAGRGTKSSFLLWINWLLLRKARLQQESQPSSASRLRVVPIVLNVKNFDLFYIDHPNNRYRNETHGEAWHALGITQATPFHNATFYAPQQRGSEIAVDTGRHGPVTPYSWSLRDIIEHQLLEYLFAETDANDANFGALVIDVQNYLTHEQTHNDSTVRYTLRSGNNYPTTFGELLTWADNKGNGAVGSSHHDATWKKLHRRLLKIVHESRGVLRRDDQAGHPLNLVSADTCDPHVVDLAALGTEPELQRFVVATILHQLVEARTGSNAIQNLKYLVTLDELNRFAPRGSRDPITRLIERVAAEMRSQGIILLGAQQQASKVSEIVIENAGIRVVGKSGAVELAQPIWRILSDSARRKAETLGLDEKLVVQDNFREPMHIRVPFPTWALNRDESANSSSPSPVSVSSSEGTTSAPLGQAADDFADLLES